MTQIRGGGVHHPTLCADSWELAPSCQNNLQYLSEDRHGAVSRLTITMSPCQHSSNLKEHAYEYNVGIAIIKWVVHYCYTDIEGVPPEPGRISASSFLVSR